jgi:amidophosphoribosyltransferase
MCGIFGIRGAPDASTLVHLGLYSLQHRGQESAGIVAVDDRGNATALRRMGLVSDGFTPEKLDALKGTLAIGHTRYSTAGSTTIENAQPILARFRDGYIALAHNGNIVNASELRRELEDTGSIFSSTMDSEVLVHRIARSRSARPEERLADALRGVEGAYSLVIATDDALLAARDPRGWRPLAMGTLNGATVFASETCALDIVGATHVRDVAAGEIVVVDGSGVRSLHFAPSMPERRCVFEYVYFARPDSILWGHNVHRVRKAMGHQLAREHPVEAELVIPVPDSGVGAALGFSEESGLPYDTGLVRNHYVGRTFIEPQQGIRHFGVKVKLNPNREVLEGRRVVVVDDSIVRGTTSRKIVKMVRAAGAREVHMRISSPPIQWPCYYGIDTPTRKELIGSSHRVQEIQKYLGADSLGYLSLEGMLKATGGDPEHFCHACFTGQYKVGFDSGERAQLRLFDS